ncbi:MAG: hypothetical protein ABID38_03080 [Candidatus Diapherotrites archaeon]
MKIAIFWILLILLAGAVYAAPTISSATETFSHGDPVLISGSGFGIKDPAPPIIWDDFEIKGNENLPQVGDLLSESPIGWDLFIGGPSGMDPADGVYPTYSNVETRNSNSQFSGMMNTPSAQYDSAAYKSGIGNLHEVYASYNFYVEHISGPPSTNMKMLRLNAGYQSWNTGTPNISVTLGINAAANPTGCYQNGKWAVPWAEETWYNWEYYLKVSEPVGTANGEAGVWINNTEFWHENNLMTMCDEATQYPSGEYAYINTVTLPYYVANCDCAYCDASCSDPGPNEYKIYYDDVYVDSTRARVEIGNEATWADSTHKEIQIPSSWSNGIIEFTANQGAFGDGNAAYLFVIDEFGEMNETGYPISFGEAPACGDGDNRPCSTGEYGICAAGTETCSADVWGECVRTNEPIAEVCTGGLDEDCDDSIDCADSEDCELEPVCIVSTCDDETNYGACSPIQPLFCSDGELIDDCSECQCPNETDTCESDGSCTVCTPEQEICDNEIDDDCDTLIDCSDTNDCELDVACEVPEICLVDFAACEIYVEGGTATCTQTWLEYEYNSDTPLDNIVTNVPANYSLNILVENLTQETSQEFIQISSSEGVLEFST